MQDRLIVMSTTLQEPQLRWLEERFPQFRFRSYARKQLPPKEELAACFPDFQPYLDKCRFLDCAHLKEKGCAVRGAVEAGEIAPSRYESYCRLYEQAKQIPDWQR